MFSIDNIIVFLYLAITLIIGFMSGIKVKNLREYSISGKNYPTTVLVATVFATIVGGGATVGDIAQIFDQGIVFIIIPFGYVIRSLIVSEFIVVNLKTYFGNAISIGDVAEKIYGRKGKILTGTCTLLFALIVVAAQVFSIGYLFYYFFGIELKYGVILGYGIVIFYSAFGGMNSIIRTDVFQFFILIAAIPIIASEALSSAGGYSQLFSSMPIEKLSFPPDQLINNIILMLIFAFFFLNPILLHRILISPSTAQVQKSFRITAILSIFLIFVIVIIALSAYNLKPDLEPNTALFYMIQEIMPPGLKGLTIAGLIAAIMSTSDSSLNSASVSLINDIIKPLTKADLSSRQELHIARISTFIAGTSTVLIAMNFKQILDIIVFAAYFWSPIMLVPICAGIRGFKISDRGFIICILTGIISSLIWIFYLEPLTGIKGIAPTVVLDILIFAICYAFSGKKIF